MTGAPPQQHEGEEGETLIELLIAMILMGVAVIAVLASLISVVNLATHNEQVTQIANTSQSYAQLLKQPVQSGQYTYKPCANPGDYPVLTAPLLPTGYSAKIDKVEYATQVPAQGGAAETINWGSTCPTTDLGLQRLTITVTVTKASAGPATSQTVAIVKRDARCSYSPLYQNVDKGPC
jgi:type II secretory pathway pseudopilin PulG